VAHTERRDGIDLEGEAAFESDVAQGLSVPGFDRNRRSPINIEETAVRHRGGRKVTVSMGEGGC
jgi:hypothetical protein